MTGRSPIHSTSEATACTDERVELAVGQLHGRHQRAGLDRVRIVQPQAQVLRGVVGGAGRDRGAARQVGEIGTEAPVATVPRTVWQLMHAVVSKTRCRASPSRPRPGTVAGPSPRRRSRRAYRPRPAAASWRAGCRSTARIDQKDPGSMRIEPRVVDAVRDQVDLAGELRNPEAVVGVGGEQRQECGSGRTDRSPERAARWP